MPSYPPRVPRTLPPGRSSARLPKDMLRETCPEDFEEIEPAPPRPPSRWIIFVPPLLLCLAVILVAAFHTWMGAPLGPEFAAEVWGYAKAAMAATVASGALGAYVVRNNERAWVQETQRPLTGPHRIVQPKLRSGGYRSLPPSRSWSRFEVDEEDGP